MLKYGEALFEQRERCEMKNGEIVIKKLPKRMNKEEGLVYYTKKLNRYWEKSYKLKNA